eukprot:10184914-Ditylum_brightwellii.AAC.1
MSNGNDTCHTTWGMSTVPGIHMPPAPSLQASIHPTNLGTSGTSCWTWVGVEVRCVTMVFQSCSVLRRNGVIVMIGGFPATACCSGENNPAPP